VIALLAISLLQPDMAASGKSIDAALSQALKFDEQTYYQICGSRRKRAQFQTLQGRALRLNTEFNRQFHPDGIIARYVDRRAASVCRSPSRFDDTARNWSQSLDVIERALNGGH
jgi:hypothetical protein